MVKLTSIKAIVYNFYTIEYNFYTMISDLITSRTRVKILTLFLANPEREFYLRDISRRLKENTNSVRRELAKLEDAGILKSRREGNLKYYSVNMENPIYDELKSIFLKTEGLGDEIRKKLNKAGGIEKAFIYGSFASGEEKLTSDIDLMIIGKVDQDKLSEIMRRLEDKLSREINYSVFSSKEFESRKKKKDAFITNVMKGKRIELI